MTTGKTSPITGRFPTWPRLTFPPWWQLWQVPAFLLGLAAILTVWAIRPLWYDPETLRHSRELARARKILDEPGTPVNDLTIVLTDALNQVERRPDLAGE